MKKHTTVQTFTATRPTVSVVTTGRLQHQYAGGQHATGGECEECKRKQHDTLQRAAVNNSPPHQTPSIAHDVLHSPGQPLDKATQSFMEPRFGHNVVFGAVQDPLKSDQGQHWLAHELTHVLQSGEARPKASITSETLSRVIDPADSQREQEASQLSQFILNNSFKASNVHATVSGLDPFSVYLQRASPEDQPHPPSEPDTGADAGAGACPPAARLDEIERNYRNMIRAARGRGANVAADNLEHFLAGSGTNGTLSVTWLRGFSSATEAERVNQQRFESQLNNQANSMSAGDRRDFSDHWDRMFTAGPTEELYYASGTSTIRSTGNFHLERTGNVVTIWGEVTQHWFDPYDWHAGLSAYIPGFGSISDADALALQNCRGARSFDMEADWQQRLNGTITVGVIYNDRDFTWTGP